MSKRGLASLVVRTKTISQLLDGISRCLFAFLRTLDSLTHEQSPNWRRNWHFYRPSPTVKKESKNSFFAPKSGWLILGWSQPWGWKQIAQSWFHPAWGDDSSHFSRILLDTWIVRCLYLFTLSVFANLFFCEKNPRRWRGWHIFSSPPQKMHRLLRICKMANASKIALAIRSH